MNENDVVIQAPSEPDASLLILPEKFDNNANYNLNCIAKINKSRNFDYMKGWWQNSNKKASNNIMEFDDVDD